ncbi:hypothetical protein CDEF62S_06385 [Castellaniella defragrans]
MGTMLMDSTPPASITSASPTRMRSAAMAIAVNPEAQNRLMVHPATDCGRPASNTPIRPTFKPCGPSGMAHPITASSMAAGSNVGACASTPRIVRAIRSSGRVWAYIPRGALPMGARVAATIYAD